jgi:ribonuclease E
MPLAGAFVSPEMASGKVWVTYPVAQSSEQQVTETETPEVLTEQVEIAQANTPVISDITEVTQQPVAEPVNDVVDAAPQEVPAEIAAADVAQPVADEPVLVEPATAEPVAETPVVDVAPEALEPAIVEPTDVLAASEVQAPAPVAEPEVKAEPVAEVKPAVETAPVAAAPTGTEAAVVAPRFKHLATAPMTKAPAPAYVPEPPRHSDWVRPEFNFEGKGSAGGHAAATTATAPATKPEMPAE